MRPTESTRSWTKSFERMTDLSMFELIFKVMWMSMLVERKPSISDSEGI